MLEKRPCCDIKRKQLIVYIKQIPFQAYAKEKPSKQSFVSVTG